MVFGSILIIVTMVLHPAGGSLRHIIESITSIQTTHALAIFSLPIILFGFYGLSTALSRRDNIAWLAFMVVSLGLIAAMFAAIFNGLALPYFLSQYTETLEQNGATLSAIANFSFAINKSLDYLFIGASCLSIFIYSTSMLRASIFPKWIPYLGFLILLFSVLGALIGFVFTNLIGFRVFTFSLATWLLASGFNLIKHQTHE